MDTSLSTNEPNPSPVSSGSPSATDKNSLDAGDAAEKPGDNSSGVKRGRAKGKRPRQSQSQKSRSAKKSHRSDGNSVDSVTTGKDDDGDSSSEGDETGGGRSGSTVETLHQRAELAMQDVELRSLTYERELKAARRVQRKDMSAAEQMDQYRRKQLVKVIVTHGMKRSQIAALLDSRPKKLSDYGELDELDQKRRPDETDISNAFVWCILHASNAKEIVDHMTQVLTNSRTPFATQIASLQLVSLIVCYCNDRTVKAPQFRRLFEERLPAVFRCLGEAQKAIQTDNKAQEFQRQVFDCLDTWHAHAMYTKVFLDLLKNMFLGHEVGRKPLQLIIVASMGIEEEA